MFGEIVRRRVGDISVKLRFWNWNLKLLYAFKFQLRSFSQRKNIENSTIQKDYCVYRFHQDWNLTRSSQPEPKKSDDFENFWKIEFFKLWINFSYKIGKKFNFSKIFKIITFFRLRLRSSSGFSTSIKSIDVLILLGDTIFDIFPLRKWPQIEIRTYGTSSNFNFKTLAVQKCRRPPSGRFLRTPYYSSSRDETSCSTSHWNWCFI